jgi:hypothetical protein
LALNQSAITLRLSGIQPDVGELLKQNSCPAFDVVFHLGAHRRVFQR